MPRTTSYVLGFDDRVCDDMHLYSVEYCLSTLTKGFNVYVLPLLAHRRSSGASMSGAYFSTLRRVVKKNRNQYKWIYTSMGDWNTMVPILAYQVPYKFARLSKR